VLDMVQRDTAFATWYNSLPIAGIDGTIENRMKGTPAQGNVHAKTGTLAKARSLSGYVTTADGERLIFSILANNTTTPGSVVTHVADDIAAALAAYREH
jgi:D-alanyl-D-alanine carboxypeptidase/D-alanyl-D-alanine-endopeptidase (penicillin-binding protein 4)